MRLNVRKIPNKKLVFLRRFNERKGRSRKMKNGMAAANRVLSSIPSRREKSTGRVDKPACFISSRLMTASTSRKFAIRSLLTNISYRKAGE